MDKKPVRPVWRCKGEDGPRDLDMPVLTVRVIDDGRRYYFYELCFWRNGNDLTLCTLHEASEEGTCKPFDDYDFWLQIPGVSDKRINLMLMCRSIEERNNKVREIEKLMEVRINGKEV